MIPRVCVGSKRRALNRLPPLIMELPPPEEGLQPHGAAWHTPMVSIIKTTDNTTYLNITPILSCSSNGLFLPQIRRYRSKKARGIIRQDAGAYRADVHYLPDNPSSITYFKDLYGFTFFLVYPGIVKTKTE